MEIRNFNEKDRAAVIALWEICGLTRPWNNPDKDITRKLEFQPDLFFVGELNDSVIASAMAGYDGHRGYVFYLAVAPEYRNLGYAKALMHHIEGVLTGLGCPKLNLVVRSSNAEVLTFYRKQGYLEDSVATIGKRLIPDA